MIENDTAPAWDRRCKLLAALTKARGEFSAVTKTEEAFIRSEKGNFKYTYADLASVLDAVTPALTANGLYLYHTFALLDGGMLEATAHVVHTAGGEITSTATVPMSGDGKLRGAQAQGSAMTFARRYSTLAVLGLAAEDDDGAEASKGDTQPADYKPANRPAAKPKPATSQPAAAEKPGEQVIEAVLTSVSDKSNKDATKHWAEFALEGFGVASSWNTKMNDAAREMVGQTVRLTFTTTQKGDKTYHNAVNIETMDQRPQVAEEGTSVEHDAVIVEVELTRANNESWLTATTDKGAIYYTNNQEFILELQRIKASGEPRDITSHKSPRGKSIVDDISAGYSGGNDTPF